MCQLPPLSDPFIASAATPQGMLHTEAARNRATEWVSLQRAVSVHLEETRFNQLSDHLPAGLLFPRLHLCIDS